MNEHNCWVFFCVMFKYSFNSEHCHLMTITRFFLRSIHLVSLPQKDSRKEADWNQSVTSSYSQWWIFFLFTDHWEWVMGMWMASESNGVRFLWEWRKMGRALQGSNYLVIITLINTGAKVNKWVKTTTIPVNALVISPISAQPSSQLLFIRLCVLNEWRLMIW